MPIYEYQCQACGHNLEALQKISDAPLVDCPACGQSELKKQVTAAAFKLTGTGWYETDFKNSGKKNGGSTVEQGKSAPETKKDSNESASSDTKKTSAAS